MLGYNELYEILRKEKYSEALQQLPKKFIENYKEYLNEKGETTQPTAQLFSDSIAKSRKELENAISIFRELMLKRKRKILNLVFIATETGIMKRDYENMLPLEKDTFDRMVQTFAEGDKRLNKLLTAKKDEIVQKNKKILVIFKHDIEQFLDHEGNTIGPFKSGELANLDAGIGEILTSNGKATLIDEKE
jgi:DNA replication initiation complex subunit (GINS family)